MKLLKLTDHEKNKEIYINLEHVISITNNNETVEIKMTNDTKIEAYMTVNEFIEAILKENE